ncbi:MAG: molybdenum cofactor guanylyltransferase [Gemmatimonadaceae bacterium]|nr:molybdenum cofactor guanylyltransferase [Gemmatimonadaceae bacterium]
MTSGRRRRCGVLLAGGAGTRFGGAPKGLAPFGDGRLCDGALAALQGCCDRNGDEVIVAANDPDAVGWFPALRVVPDAVPDAVPGRGALAALAAAFQAAGDATVIVCAWDLPFVTTALLAALARVVEAGATACVPVHPDGTAEPLCAAWAPSCAASAATLLAANERAGHALLHAVRGVRWPVAEHLRDAEAERIFHNVNTRDDLRRALAWLPRTSP